MRTQKQIAASRENGRKSHGATTPEGKARIVQANLVSGLYAEDHEHQWEWRGELQDMKDEYYKRHPPASPEARCLLDQIILCEYQLRRFTRLEDVLWDKFHGECPRGVDPRTFALLQGERSFARLQHRINSTRRAYQSSLKDLERLELRDQDVIVEPPGPEPATDSFESQLPVLGSLRTNPAAEREAFLSGLRPAPGSLEDLSSVHSPVNS